MVLLACTILLFCLSAYSESTVISQETGRSINLTCSLDECPENINGYKCLYLLHEKNEGLIREKNEVLFLSLTSQGEAAPRGNYKSRIQTHRSTMTFTISDVTVNDTGIYKCVYKKSDKVFDICSVYGVFITETTPCPMMSPTNCPTFFKPRTIMMWFLILICIISVLAMWIFFLMIIPRVKQWWIWRRARGDQKVTADNVYEIMSRNSQGQAA